MNLAWGCSQRRARQSALGSFFRFSLSPEFGFVSQIAVSLEDMRPPLGSFFQIRSQSRIWVRIANWRRFRNPADMRPPLASFFQLALNPEFGFVSQIGVSLEARDMRPPLASFFQIFSLAGFGFVP